MSCNYDFVFPCCSCAFDVFQSGTGAVAGAEKVIFLFFMYFLQCNMHAGLVY